MSAEALLENPALFSGHSVSPFALSREYLDLANPEREGYVPIYDFNKCVKAHIARFLHAPIKKLNKLAEVSGEDENEEGEEFTAKLSRASNVDDLFGAVDAIEAAYNQRESSCFVEDRYSSWYRRHRPGVIETDREKRKRQHDVWLDSGLRMSR